MARDGLYSLAPGGQGYPQNISGEFLPEELNGIDGKINEVSLAYDLGDGGVHIYLTASTSSTTLHWWYDEVTKSFWPVSLVAAHEPTAVLQYTAENASDSAVLLGGRDGYIRRYKDDMATDDGTVFSSHIWYGPINASGDTYKDAIFEELIVAPSANSGHIHGHVFVGDTPEEAYNSTAFGSYNFFTPALNYKARPKARGNAAYVRFDNTEYLPWSLERVTTVFKLKGKTRL
jgi:hypothetical protein